MTLKQVPGALALGLLASLIVHTLLFGNDHAMGGAFNALILELATAGCVGFAAFLGGLAWQGAGRAADGSILSARLADRLPSWPALCIAAVSWFAAGEAVEPHHGGAGVLATAVCLLATTWLLRVVARSLVRLVAHAVLAAARVPFAARIHVWHRPLVRVAIPRRFPLLRRRFARPPPIANARA